MHIWFYIFVHICAYLCLWYICIYLYILFVHILAYFSLLCTYIAYFFFAYFRILPYSCIFVPAYCCIFPAYFCIFKSAYYGVFTCVHIQGYNAYRFIHILKRYTYPYLILHICTYYCIFMHFFWHI